MYSFYPNGQFVDHSHLFTLEILRTPSQVFNMVSGLELLHSVQHRLCICTSDPSHLSSHNPMNG